MSDTHTFLDMTYVSKNSRRGTFIVSDGQNKYEYSWGLTIGLNENTILVPGETKIRVCLDEDSINIISARI